MVMLGVLFDGTQLTRIQTKNHKVEGAEMNIIINLVLDQSFLLSLFRKSFACLS